MMAIQMGEILPGAINCVNNVAVVKPGEQVLILADTSCDPDVIEAYRIAGELAGGNVSVLTLKSNVVGSGPNEINERGYFVPWPRIAWEAMVASDVTLNLSYFIEIHSIFGAGQGDYDIKGHQDLRTRYNVRLVRVQIATKEQLASAYAVYPQDLLQFIGVRAYRAVRDAAKGDYENAVVRVVDPEGTDITYNGFEMLVKWRLEGEKIETAGWRDFGSYNVGLKPWGKEPNAEGVIVSSALHTGRIPQMRVTVKGGEGVDIEGGGEVGIRWLRDWKQKKDITSEGRLNMKSGKPGVSWLEECMFATHPKAFPLGDKYRYEGTLADHSWFTGSRRSGTLHFALGGGVRETYKHRDLEIFWPTMTINGIPIIDKGRLLVLDSQEVRIEAAKYGDPDELLTEDWIPEIPR